MAGHNESNGSEKKLSDATNDLQTFNAENLQSNMKVVYYSRTFLSIIGGVIAGILGFTGFTGFIFYFLVMATTSIGLLAKSQFSVHSYFDSWNRIILDGFFGGLMSFVLFWTQDHATSPREAKSFVAAAAGCGILYTSAGGWNTITESFVSISRQSER